MPTQTLQLRLPEDLVRRLKRRIPAGGRTAFVQHLLEKALPADDVDEDALYQAALEVDRDQKLGAEMADWNATAGDGLAAKG